MVILERVAALALLPLVLSSAPAFADSMTSTQLGVVFCIGRLSGDMAPVLAVLTPKTRTLVEKTGIDRVRWQGKPDYANICEPVGASGTYEAPQVILSYRYREEGKSGFSDRLVMRFVDGLLRLDDILFSDGESMRDSLAGD
ncbi:hypothetical protein [Devosia sp. CN2-171]|uniref:hypothetical protein n=1 Tax=Devosia sp. CN2-171 TaxID=3400909 RepID=UPI003BF7B100